MEIEINPANNIPIYRQIVNQVRYLVAFGSLEPDRPLLSIRTLAGKLKVSPNTIVKAYEELAAQGVVQRRRGRGTFVSNECPRLVDGQWRHLIEPRIDALLVEAQQLNLPPEALLELMHRRQAILAHVSSLPPGVFAASRADPGVP
jgi:GntR family transcriptional regulator